MHFGSYLKAIVLSSKEGHSEMPITGLKDSSTVFAGLG
jgi:hypothetical protein